MASYTIILVLFSIPITMIKGLKEENDLCESQFQQEKKMIENKLKLCQSNSRNNNLKLIIFKNKKYLIDSTLLTIEQNQQLCERNEMTLAFIKNEGENRFLTNNTQRYLRLGAIWNQTEQSFKWKDGSKMEYTNWLDHSQSICPSNCCTVQLSHTGKWFSSNCASSARAVCESKIEKDTEKIARLEAQLRNKHETIDQMREELGTFIMKKDEEIANLLKKYQQFVANVTLEMKKSKQEQFKNNVQDKENDFEDKKNEHIDFEDDFP